jgi:non-canonical purine NTP pyrophosphatase (RdgB/HAM1 family)
MKQITFVTGNEQKLRAAQAVLEPRGITVTNTKLDVVEIQDEDGEVIARDKAQKAYDQLQEPLLVNDDIWIIPGLNGFPGPYMKSINHWFTADDWLRLTAELTDRRIILRQYVVYQDEHGQQLFRCDIEGVILREAKGEASNHNDTIVSFNDQGLSNAEVRASGISSIQHRKTAWHDVAEWLAAKN